MGLFSFICQDTDRPIGINALRNYYMWDNKGNRWKQNVYLGYGEFGNKDFYVLLAEMNNDYKPIDTDETKRKDGIELYFSKKNILWPNLTECKEWKWINDRPKPDSDQGGCNDDDTEVIHRVDKVKRIYRDLWKQYNGKTSCLNMKYVFDCFQDVFHESFGEDDEIKPLTLENGKRKRLKDNEELDNPEKASIASKES